MASRRILHRRPYKPSLKTMSIFLTHSDSGWWLILLNMPLMLFCPVAGLDSAEAEETAGPLPKEWYVSGFVTRSYPIDSLLKVKGDEIPNTRFDGSFGGGLKIGGFPSSKSVIGGELELSGYGGSITAPRTMIGTTVRSAQLDTTAFNFMVNVLARYPGDIIQPYAGIGVGFSVLEFDGPTQSASGIREPDGFAGFAMQSLIGVRLIVTDHLFGFAEYKPSLFLGKEGDPCIKCSGSRPRTCRRIPNCTTPPLHSLNFYSHCVAVGIGFRF
jgi:opacity protein-like surface antigen